MFQKRKTDKTDDQILLESLRKAGIECDLREDGEPMTSFQIRMPDGRLKNLEDMSFEEFMFGCGDYHCDNHTTPTNENRCVYCQCVIPQGRMICVNCEVKANDALHGGNG